MAWLSSTPTGVVTNVDVTVNRTYVYYGQILAYTFVVTTTITETEYRGMTKDAADSAQDSKKSEEGTVVCVVTATGGGSYMLVHSVMTRSFEYPE